MKFWIRGIPAFQPRIVLSLACVSVAPGNCQPPPGTTRPHPDNKPRYVDRFFERQKFTWIHKTEQNNRTKQLSTSRILKTFHESSIRRPLQPLGYHAIQPAVNRWALTRLAHSQSCGKAWSAKLSKTLRKTDCIQDSGFTLNIIVHWCTLYNIVQWFHEEHSLSKELCKLDSSKCKGFKCFISQISQMKRFVPGLCCWDDWAPHLWVPVTDESSTSKPTDSKGMWICVSLGTNLLWDRYTRCRRHIVCIT